MPHSLKELPSGHYVEVIKGEEEKKMKEDFFMYFDGAVRLHPGGWVFPYHFIKYAPLIYNFEVTPTDIFVSSFPKSGTTWAQEIVWNLVLNPNLDNPAADASVDERVPNTEGDMFLANSAIPPIELDGDTLKLFETLCPGKDYRDGLLIQLATHMPSPRMLKNHLPFCLLPPNLLETCKVVYVARDPRDVISSMYHYARLQVLWGYRGTLNDFVDYVVKDQIHFGPYWSHLKLGWENRHHRNFCLVFYEDLKENAEREMRRIDKFLGTNRSDEQIRNIAHYTSFSQMKERTKGNPPASHDHKFYNQEVAEKEGGFFRKGVTGDWKESFTAEQKEKLNAWMAKNLEQFGEDFKYKI